MTKQAISTKQTDVQPSTPGITDVKPHAEFCGIILAGLPANDPRITDRLLVSQLIHMAEATNSLFKENRCPNFTTMRDTYGVILAKGGPAAFAIGEWMAEARVRADAGSELVSAFVKKLDSFRTPNMTSITDEGLLGSFVKQVQWGSKFPRDRVELGELRHWQPIASDFAQAKTTMGSASGPTPAEPGLNAGRYGAPQPQFG